MDFVKSVSTLLNNHVATDAVVCDDFTPMDFDATRFMGTWYEQMHVQDPQEPTYYQCETAQYTNLDATAGTFKVYNSFQTPFFSTYLPRFGVHADATCDSQAACYVVFFGHVTPEPNLNIVETDYENYAINYRCDVEDNKIYVWLNTREPVVSDDYMQWLYNRAVELFPHFDTSEFDPQIYQGDKCSYKDL